MPEAQQETGKKRWLGYTCPDCRMIFRIEAGFHGQRAQCPGCHALKVLGGGDTQEPSPVDAEPKDIYSEAEIEDTPNEGAVSYLEEGGTMRRRVAILGPAEADQDELNGERAKPSAETGNMALTVLLLVMLVFVGGIGYLVYGIVREDLRSEDAATEAERIAALTSAVVELLENDEPEVVIDLDLVAELARMKPAVEAFLTAKTVDEMLEWVRHRERLEPVIREYYREHDYLPSRIREIAPKGKVQTIESLYSVVVELQNYSQRPIAVENLEDDYRIDWESWVGHSEMAWEKFLRDRTLEPRMFRARCSPVEYYNFDFSDDSKWQSFRLESPDEEFLIFGYAERSSEIALALKSRDDEKKDKAVIVVLEFPADPRSRNQVIIREFLGSGWVLDDVQE